MSDTSIIDAFAQYGFMRRSLIACLALSLSLTPLGIFMQLRKMSLVGDALSHAVLPGVAIGFMMSGMSLLSMSIGGVLVGSFVAIFSGWLSERAKLQEDATFAGLYLGSLALGVTLLSIHNTGIDLLHLLFGSILAIDKTSLLFIGAVCSFSLLVIAFGLRALVYESFDATFLTLTAKRTPNVIHALFMGLTVLNLVAGFQILGTLMTVGLMMLPAISARCWCNRLFSIWLLAMSIACISSLIGLTCSWYFALPAGPSIVLCAFCVFLFSVLFGHEKGVMSQHYRRYHI